MPRRIPQRAFETPNDFGCRNVRAAVPLLRNQTVFDDSKVMVIASRVRALDNEVSIHRVPEPRFEILLALRTVEFFFSTGHAYFSSLY